MDDNVALMRDLEETVATALDDTDSLPVPAAKPTAAASAAASEDPMSQLNDHPSAAAAAAASATESPFEAPAAAPPAAASGKKSKKSKAKKAAAAAAAAAAASAAAAAAEVSIAPATVNEPSNLLARQPPDATAGDSTPDRYIGGSSAAAEAATTTPTPLPRSKPATANTTASAATAPTSPPKPAPSADAALSALAAAVSAGGEPDHEPVPAAQNTGASPAAASATAPAAAAPLPSTEAERHALATRPMESSEIPAQFLHLQRKPPSAAATPTKSGGKSSHAQNDTKIAIGAAPAPASGGKSKYVKRPESEPGAPDGDYYVRDETDDAAEANRRDAERENDLWEVRAKGARSKLDNLYRTILFVLAGLGTLVLTYWLFFAFGIYHYQAYHNFPCDHDLASWILIASCVGIVLTALLSVMIVGLAYFAIRVRDIVWRAPRADLEAAIACSPLTEHQKMRLLLLILLALTPIVLFLLVWLFIGSTWVYSFDRTHGTCPHELYSFVYHFISGTWLVVFSVAGLGPYLYHKYRPLHILHLRDELDASNI